MTRFRTAFAVATAAALMTATAGAQQPQHAHPDDHDAHHRDMLTRGPGRWASIRNARFIVSLLYPDGGAIEVTVKEASDQANLQAIRRHLPEIAALFKAGDFGKPALTHAQQVPGTVEMTRLKDRITYQYRRNAGGRAGADRHA